MKRYEDREVTAVRSATVDPELSTKRESFRFDCVHVPATA